MKRELILASASPRRAELLSRIGISFAVVESDVPEEAERVADPVDHVLRLSRLKARRVADIVGGGIVLGADTEVVLDGEVLGKPSGDEDAFRMLSMLSGRTHRVITGLTLIDVEAGWERSDFVSTYVRMRTLDRELISWYIRTGEPFDKAGAYGIQGKGAVLVEGIEGCFYNVVGLPIAKLVEMLEEAGLRIWEGEQFK